MGCISLHALWYPFCSANPTGYEETIKNQNTLIKSQATGYYLLYVHNIYGLKSTPNIHYFTNCSPYIYIFKSNAQEVKRRPC